MTKSKPKIGAVVTLDNGVSYELFEGNIVRDLSYEENGTVKTISGSVRVLGGSVNRTTAYTNSCPPEPYIDDFISINYMIVDSSTEFDAELTRVNIANITSIGSVETDAAGVIAVGSGPQFKSLVDVIAEAPAGATVKLADGEYNVPLTLNKSVKITGSVGAIVTGAISVEKGADGVLPVVEIDGVTLSGDALVTLKNADAFTMTNCVFKAHNLTKKSYPVNITTSDPILIKIENCRFEDQNEFSYNLFELLGKLKDGSSISNNTFTGAACSHNLINLYDVVDGATIKINNNYAERSANMVRIGFKNAAKCTVIMDGNKYDTTEVGDWGGLFLVQPYGTATSDMSNVNIAIFNTIKPDGQIGYLYNGANDMQFTDANKPTITVDGVVFNAPVYS